MVAQRRARRGAGWLGGTPALGFLDVNFGVFGIFLVVFAVRVLLQTEASAMRPDLLVLVSAGPVPEQGRAEILSDGAPPVEIVAPLDNPFRPDNAFGTATRAVLVTAAEGRAAPLSVGIVLLPDGFDAMKALNAVLSDAALTGADDFLPVSWTVIPAEDSARARRIVTEWEEG
ncbi:hypothetical protein [Pseudoponticoccus marisrubri]|uniref:Uncharacterized protein n=1 Tax=Pseudoponticoccus marisrubri TaxID=1685382 RepID=A0A0W7WPC6_9RHOB|nr:hypothetical protein [Pseudoponticoccus marisrubri]KUF12450.1 hypothetical protein AVJ23_01590 [Pseudoponticoccus marisrubri]